MVTLKNTRTVQSIVHCLYCMSGPYVAIGGPVGHPGGDMADRLSRPLQMTRSAIPQEPVLSLQMTPRW